MNKPMMTEIGSRQRHQPAPLWVIFDDLCNPYRQSARPWLHLQNDEMAPAVLRSERPNCVIWSSLGSLARRRPSPRRRAEHRYAREHVSY
jgi:hypothetical protein